MTVRYSPLGAGYIVTSPYGPRPGGIHTGTDFGFPGGSAGRPVYAIQSGTVLYAGAAQGYGGPDPAGWLVIDSTDAEGGGCLEYGHIICEVGAGDYVQAGQRIAHINPDPASNGGVTPHLHVSDMPRQYNPAAKQDVLPRLAGALDPTHPAAELKVPMAKTSTDTLFADVSEWQKPVDDSYPYQVLSIRCCDGTYTDRNFPTNYRWMRAALDNRRLTFGIVYSYLRPATWRANLQTIKQVFKDNGGNHERIAFMLDVESGGNGSHDQSDSINRLYWGLVDWGMSAERIIGYGNTSDLDHCWPTKPDGIKLVVAGYGRLPSYPGMIAHQYTDGNGYGGGLPEGAPPFGNCDMNAANGLTPEQFAAACGITTPAAQPPPASPTQPAPTPPTELNATEQHELLTKIRDIWDQLRGPGGNGWPQLAGRTPVDALADIALHQGIPGYSPAPTKKE